MFSRDTMYILTDGGIVLMGRKPSVINLTETEREYLETQTRARTIQAQTVSRARILLLKAELKLLLTDHGLTS